jgi:DNA/RNA non-specific endonuclease
LPRPKYSFSYSDGRADNASVEDLSANRPMGSAPYQNPLGWSYLQDTDQTTGKAPYYRRLHLINHRLGGPGQKQNLVPGSQQNNSKMEKDFEAPIKDLVGHEPLQAGKTAIVSMNVKVEYGYAPKKQSRTGANKDYPERIICTWDYLEKPKSRVRKKGKRVPLEVPQPA